MLKFHLFLIHLLSNLPCPNLHSKAYLKKSIHFQDFWQFLYLLLPRIKVVHILYIELCIKRFLSPLFLPMKRNIWSLLSQTKATFHHKWIFKAYENKTMQDNKSCTVNNYRASSSSTTRDIYTRRNASVHIQTHRQTHKKNQLKDRLLVTT